MATNPMHQFTVYKLGPEINLGNFNLSYTNASLYMTISAALILLLLFIGTKKKTLIPSKIQLVTELSYTFVAKMINDTAGKSAKAFFPFVFTLFMFVQDITSGDCILPESWAHEYIVRTCFLH